MIEADIDALFLQARDLSAHERRLFLDGLAPAVRNEVESLLAFDSEDDKTPALGNELRQALNAGVTPTLVAGVSSPEAKEPEPPSTRYPVKGKVGQGGMGVVLEVRDETLRRDIAMKLLLDPSAEPGSSGDSNQMRRFIEEAQITGQLDHPGVVPVYEMGKDDNGRSYFTMRLVKGITLAQAFTNLNAKKNDWTQARILSALLRVCETVAYAHDRKVIHRDLKPSNIMLGKYGEAYVMDWGLAKVLDGVGEPSEDRPPHEQDKSVIQTERKDDESNSEESPILTLDGDVLGTPAYMSPEQARGETEKVRQPSDVYSMGAILYQLLAGERPYRSRGEKLSPRMIHAQVIQGPPDSVLDLAPKAPPELVAICDKAMSRSIEKRYLDMSGMADDLRAFLDNRVVKAYRTGAWVELSKWVKRNKGMAAALLSLVVVAAVGMSAYLYVTAKSKSELQREKNAAQRSLTLLQAMLSAAHPDNLYGPDYTVRQLLDDFEQSQLLDDTAESPEVLATVRSTLAMTYQQLGSYEKAERHIQEALRIRRAIHGQEHVEVAAAYNHLSLVLESLGRFVEAETSCREALDMRRRLLGEEHDEVANSLSNLALILEAQGRLAEAESLYRQAINLKRRLQGDEDESVAMVLSNLASVLEARGSLAEAEKLHRQALDLKRRVAGDTNPSVAMSLNGLASSLRAQGRFSESEPFQMQALEMNRRFFGEKHHSTAISLGNLARDLSGQARFAEAEELHRQELELLHSLLGDEHVSIAISLGNLADTLHHQARFSEAETLYRQALEMDRRLLGEEHPSVAASLGNLAGILHSLGQLDDAKELHRQALDMKQRLFGEEHPSVATSLGNLAFVLRDQGRLTEAEELQWQALEMNRRLLGDEHPSVATSLSNLAGILHSLGRLDDAEGLHRQALDMNQRLLGEEHPDVTTSLGLLATVLTDQGKLDEAERKYRDAIAIDRKNASSNLSILLQNFLAILPEDTRPNDRSEILIELERYEEAEPLLRDALEQEKLEDSKRRQATVLLGLALNGLGQFIDAEALLTDSYFEWEDAGDLEDALKAQLLKALIDLYKSWEKPGEVEVWQGELDAMDAR